MDQWSESVTDTEMEREVERQMIGRNTEEPEGIRSRKRRERNRKKERERKRR